MSGLEILFGAGAAAGAGTGAGLVAAEFATGAFAAPMAIGTATAATAGGVISSVLPWASLGMTAIGAVNAAGAQTGSGNAARAAAEYNAQVNRLNADMMDREAAQVRAATDYSTSQLKSRQMRFASMQAARLASSGVSMASDSPLMQLNETARLSALDRYMNDYQGEIQITSLKNKASILRSNADFTAWSGGVAQQNAYDTATGTLVAGLGKMGGNYYTMKRSPTYSDYFA